MLIVIYGHEIRRLDNAYIFFVFAGPIEVTLFLVVSGFLFKPSISLSEFIKKIFFGLISPWLALSILPVMIISVFKGLNYFFTSVISILTGNSVWFMPCCIIAEIIFYSINKALKKEIPILISSVMMTVAGVFLIKCGYIDFLMINRAISVQIFLCLGLLIKKHEDFLDRVQRIHLILGFMIYVFVGVISIIYCQGEYLDVHRGIYYNIPICTIMILTGCTYRTDHPEAMRREKG